jgi:hypothetical protein
MRSKAGQDPYFIISSRSYYPAMAICRTSREKQARPSSTLLSPHALNINTNFYQKTPSPTKTTHPQPSKWTLPPPMPARMAPSSGSTTRRDTASSPPRTVPPTCSSTSAPSRYVAHPFPAALQVHLTDSHHRRTVSSPLRRARLSPSSLSRARRACRPPASATTKRC